MEKCKKKSYRNKKYGISIQTWMDEFKLPDGSYSVLGIQGYFDYITKNMTRS